MFQNRIRALFDPGVEWLARAGVSPMLVSGFGLLVSAYGAYQVTEGRFLAAAVWLLAAGIADIVDGALARRVGRASRLGAFIDSTFDRIAELAYLSALIIYYSGRAASDVVLGLLCIVISASVLTSYTRARIEGLGEQCSVGWMERPERIIVLIVGLIFGPKALPFFLFVLAVGATITVLQRIAHARRVLRQPDVGSQFPQA